MHKKILALLFVLSFVPALGNEPLARAREGRNIEVGISAGYPVGAGMLIGYWGKPEFPLVARLSTGVGTMLDLGWGLTSEDLDAYVGVSGGLIGYLGVYSKNQTFLGPTVGLRWKVFTISVGPSVMFVGGEPAVLRGAGQLTYSGFF
ncbi:hypothetical protein K2X33_15480 [bacterium]|nr:hypothetical protein [bacterium]